MPPRPPTSKSLAGPAFLYLLLRDLIPLPLVLAAGAALQWSLPRFLPSGSLVVLLVVMAAWTPLLVRMGLKEDERKKDVRLGRTCAQLREGDDGPKEMAVMLIGARTNSFWGVFDKRGARIGKQFQSLINDLVADPDSGLLGMEPVLKLSTFTRNRLQTQLYFTSMEKIHKFAHQPKHIEVWKEFNLKGKDGGMDDIELWHEAYEIKAGKVDAIYVNAKPHGLGACFELVKNEDGVTEGEGEWKSLLMDVKGKKETMKGRTGM